MSQQWKGFKQRYYRNINSLRLCRPVLLSGSVQSEHVAAGKVFKPQYYGYINTLSICRPVLLSDNFQTEHVAAGKFSHIDIIGTLTL